jgi:lipopolysaccharide/colanic/teichoic acid biosynthesis glycosyltransferase
VYLPGTQNLTKGALPLQPVGFEPQRQVGCPPLNAQRIFDIVLSAGAILFFAPLMLAIAIAIKLEDGGPVFFGQDRVGFGGRIFKCLKFRSMVADAEARLADVLRSDPEVSAYWESHRKLKKDPRVTLVGRFLRKSSLDELPQLLNIFSGDMSAVGPRPIMPSEADLYGRWLKRYCTVRPGLTCLWQIRGRNHLSFRQRIALDLVYLRSASLAVYFVILLKTPGAVLARHGSY